jgi:hypothetical protein
MFLVALVGKSSYRLNDGDSVKFEVFFGAPLFISDARFAIRVEVSERCFSRVVKRSHGWGFFTGLSGTPPRVAKIF